MGTLFTTTSMRRSLGALLLAVGLVQAAAAQTGSGSAPGVIVKFKDGTIAKAGGLESKQAVAAAQREKVQAVLKRIGVENPAAMRSKPAGRDWQRIDFERELSASEARQWANKLAAQPDVEWAVPNTREKLLVAERPNDSLYDSQWWLKAVSGANANVKADRLRGVPGVFTGWDREESSNVVVAVLDTGITEHEDLDDDRILSGYDFVSDEVLSNDGDGRDADPSDPGDWVTQEEQDANVGGKFNDCSVSNSSWHGTIISGIIAARTNNNRGVAAVNRGARILPVRVAAKCGGLLSDIADAIRWSAGLSVDGVDDNPNPAKIINVSFGSNDSCEPTYQEAIEEAWDAGAVVVAAAGNSGGDVARPANCDRVIAVGAVNRDGFKTNYSSFGREVDLMTVGGDDTGTGNWGSLLGDGGLMSLTNNGRRGPEGDSAYEEVFGTSFSAPIVSATISLMLGIDDELGPEEIVQGLRDSARRHVRSALMLECTELNPGRCICTTSTCGAGLLDVDQALRYAQAQADGTGYTAPNWPAVSIDSDDVAAAVAANCKDVFTDGNSCDNDVDTSDPDDDERFGGALSLAWLLGLLLAVGSASRIRRRRFGH